VILRAVVTFVLVLLVLLLAMSLFGEVGPGEVILAFFLALVGAAVSARPRHAASD
jgi:drug/metabolite transporter (DMT)-like permease